MERGGHDKASEIGQFPRLFRNVETVPISEAEDHLFGITLYNEASARDMQSREYQPPGPLLSKHFGSMNLVTTEAMAPYRVARSALHAGSKNLNVEGAGMAQVHAVSGDVVSLRPLGASLGKARTTAILKTPQFELIRLVFRQGTALPEHQVAGEMTLLCLEGSVDLSLPTGMVSLQAQELIHLSGGVRHGLVAATDASLLLTIRI